MDMLIKLKNDDLDGLTVEELAAQAFIFFLAGFDTSSTTLAFCFYELAFNPIVQQRARDEIRDRLQRHGGKLSYEAIMEIQYIDQIIKGKIFIPCFFIQKSMISFSYYICFTETLRLYPPVTNLSRETERDYLVPGMEFVLEEKTRIFIPTYAIHHDPEYYPDPERFDPDRFAPAEVARRDSVLWLPFGDGPRNCIGYRFGMMQLRVGLVTLLNSFEFGPSERTQRPLKFSKEALLLMPEGGMWLKIKKI